MTGVAVTGAAAPSLARDLIMLTKPRIISLLLVTTVAPMFVAGDPSWGLVLLVTVGGYLMAGGANAVNMYLDRDIDDRMSRTRLRPIPSGRLGASSVLAFGVALAAAATWLFAFYANLLTAALALAGFYFYVFVYTRWLKRSTPQNIVIGGAAGAVPPLVGWAAATGNLTLPALWLFLIVFFWTPPHFWALALLIRRDYEAARVPMLPVVKGEAQTARSIVTYSLVLLGISLLPFLSNTLGVFYLVSAVALGLAFVALAIALRRHTTPANARRLFSFSLAYLALLFVAMALDPILF